MPRTAGGSGTGFKTGKSSIYRGVTLFRPTGKWRAQISAAGKTTSLGDHNTEEQAARAFDRALINKDGRDARINFPLTDYEHEYDYLRGLTQLELVAVLRNQARKTGNRSSAYRGVSLLKQTGKWHAQIRCSGKPLHLGYFRSEQEAAEAYDRAAIFRALKDGDEDFDAQTNIQLADVQTNFQLANYQDELETLSQLTEEELIAELNKDGSPRHAYESSPLRAQSPGTPDVSSERMAYTEVGRALQQVSSRSVVPYRGILKARSKNRRCRRAPVRSPF